ncbi:4693_t:CDS:1, partial [Funneliformis geosporum]
KSKSITGWSGSSPSINSCKEWPSHSDSMASISFALSAPRKCLGLTLLSQILYRDTPISESL